MSKKVKFKIVPHYIEEIKKHSTLFFLCLFAIGVLTAIDIAVSVKKEKSAQPEVLSYIPQYVLLSFDGSKDISIWEETRKFAQEMNRAGKPLRFTYFINAAYFLTNEVREKYQGPGELQGYTEIGVSDGIEDIRKRIVEVNGAISEGHEIASHTVGHFSGRMWSKEQWEKEFVSFNSLLFNLDELYQHDNLPKLNLTANDILGFRAPYLDQNQHLFEALHVMNFAYDSSEVSVDNGWPKKDAEGMWRIPLGMTHIGVGKRPIIAMDYNIYMLQTGAQSLLTKESPEWARYHDDILNAYRDYFTSSYTGNRSPVLIGHHFGHWNDSLYWEAMKSFALEVCGKPEVICGTFKELVGYMNEKGVPEEVK